MSEEQEGVAEAIAEDAEELSVDEEPEERNPHYGERAYEAAKKNAVAFEFTMFADKAAGIHIALRRPFDLFLYEREDNGNFEAAAGDGTCWKCGKSNVFITTHHGIPKRLLPVRNVCIPVCKECHEEINALDVPGLKELAKILISRVGRLQGGLNKFADYAKELYRKQRKRIGERW